MTINLSKFKQTLGANFPFAAILFLALSTGVCHAESAVEAIVRESKNNRVDPMRAKPPQAQAKAVTPALGKAQEAAVLASEKGGEMINQKPPALLQRLDEIIVQGQQEPEDVTPPQKPAFQKMKEKLDSVGKSLPPSVAEGSSNDGTRTAVFKRGGACYSIKNNAGRMNNDGSLGSAGRESLSCTASEAAAK